MDKQLTHRTHVFLRIDAPLIHSGTHPSSPPQHYVVLSKFAHSFVDLRKVHLNLCDGTHTSSSRSPQIRTQTSMMVTRCSTLLVNKLPITLNIQIDLRHGLHCACASPGRRSSSWLSCKEQHSPQVMSPTSSYSIVTFFLRTARMNIQLAVENSLEQFNEHPKRRRVYGEVPVPPQGQLYDLQNLVHRVRDYWWNQIYIALHYQQEQFVNAGQEHRRVASYEHVKIAAAGATSRSVRLISVNNEDYFPKSG